MKNKMTKHKHSEMIKAKADNMELVLFSMSTGSDYGKWSECKRETMPKDNENIKYFLCLPQHKDVCLYWLNGGDVIVRDYPDDERERVLLASGYSNWHDASVFMCERTTIRIKPKKEKRWIAVTRHNCIDKLFDNKSQAEEFVTGFYPNNHVSDFQFIEIEIEV